MNPKAMELYGIALLDYFNGDESATLTIRRDDGYESPLHVHRFFCEPSGFTSTDKAANENCREHVLDVGGGTGLHSLVLQQKGFTVTAIDINRQAVEITITRNAIPNVNPGGMVWGPKVCLIDEFTASDGDIFPYRFKQHKLGKLIGKRTWGGVVGIRGSLPLLDGGFLYKPEFSRYDLEGKEWVMEGHGVEPDIYVDNDPAKEFAGIDEQLNKAIEVIFKELKIQEKTIPPVPQYPVKVPKK